MKKLLLVLLLILSNLAVAHSGRTDESGCHIDNRTGTYHCH